MWSVLTYNSFPLLPQANRTTYLLGGRCSNELGGTASGVLGYCARTAFALLGMKSALSLRSTWANRRHRAQQGDGARLHALVMVMRHDVTWNAPLPVDGAGLAATPGARLWLPFACELCSGPDAQQKACRSRKKAFQKAWDRTDGTGTLQAPSQFLARSCVARGHQSFGPHCQYTVPVDWWWAGDATLADSFAATFDLFECFSRLILDLMGWPNAAPHFYWGLYFFHTLQLARRCEVGYVGLAKVHFDLERTYNKKISCTLPSRWPALLKPDREGCGKGALLAHMQCPLPPSQRPEVHCAARLLP